MQSQNLPPGFKIVKTRFKGNYQLPTDWEMYKFGDTVDMEYGFGLKEEERSDGPFPVYGSGGIVGNHSKFAVHGPGIVVARKGSLGKVFFEKNNFWPIDTVFYITQDKTKFYLGYLAYLLDHLRLRNYAIITAQPGISREEINTLQVRFPPSAQQQKIASILSKVDDLIQKTDEIIQQTLRLKKGLMQRLLAEGIGHTKFKQTEIGSIPLTWELRKLDYALEICQYGLSLPMQEEGKYPIVRMNEIEDGQVVRSIRKFVDLDGETFRAFKLENGDILFNRTNSYELVGRTGIFEQSGEFVFASYLIRLRVKKHIFISKFLTKYLILNNDKLKKFATRAVHQVNINATNLKQLLVPIPPLNEQEGILKILASMEDYCRHHQQVMIFLDDLKKGLMQKLLTGQIRVKV